MQKREKRREEKKKSDIETLGSGRIEPMPGLKKKRRDKKKKEACHIIEPGSTDTKRYRLLRLQAYNSDGPL